MSEHEARRRVALPPEAAWAWVSEPDHLPQWLTAVTAVRLPAPDHLELDGERGGVGYALRGLWRARPEQRRLEWGSEGTGRYAGWLQVEDSGEGHSEVVVHLSFLEAARREGLFLHADEGLEGALDALAAALGASA